MLNYNQPRLIFYYSRNDSCNKKSRLSRESDQTVRRVEDSLFFLLGTVSFVRILQLFHLRAVTEPLRVLDREMQVFISPRGQLINLSFLNGESRPGCCQLTVSKEVLSNQAEPISVCSVCSVERRCISSVMIIHRVFSGTCVLSPFTSVAKSSRSLLCCSSIILTVAISSLHLFAHSAAPYRRYRMETQGFKLELHLFPLLQCSLLLGFQPCLVLPFRCTLQRDKNYSADFAPEMQAKIVLSQYDDDTNSNTDTLECKDSTKIYSLPLYQRPEGQSYGQ